MSKEKFSYIKNKQRKKKQTAKLSKKRLLAEGITLSKLSPLYKKLTKNIYAMVTHAKNPGRKFLAQSV